MEVKSEGLLDIRDESIKVHSYGLAIEPSGGWSLFLFLRALNFVQSWNSIEHLECLKLELKCVSIACSEGKGVPLKVEHPQSLRKTMNLLDRLLELSQSVVRDVETEELWESLDYDSKMAIV